MTSPARYLLSPGRPWVYRRRPGRWAYECHCAPLGRRGAISSAMPNLDSQAEALREALAHVRHDHIDPLEWLYLLPSRSTVKEG